MDIQALSNMNSQLTSFLNSIKQTSTLNNSTSTKSSNSSNSGIVLAKKGDSGYIESMDADKDGEITLEEFNEYCESNGVSEKEKVKLAALMTSAKTSEKIVSNTAETQKNITSSNEDESSTDTDSNTENSTSIYARKGDDKYNEAMDTNKNGEVTYQEYMEYCNKKVKSTDGDNSPEAKAAQAYEQNENYDEEPDITVEAEA
jgi:hypothetical protein